MAQFYLDIETTGLNPEKDQIITIQYVQLDSVTSMPIGELKILKAWESSEKEIIHKFIEDSKILEDYSFSFVSVGYNLGFEHNFFLKRTKLLNLPVIDILSLPFLDLRAVGILMNNGRFKGSGLDKITGKIRDGSLIPTWYNNKEYDKIIDYIKNETEEFCKFASWLYSRMPGLLKQFKEENEI